MKRFLAFGMLLVVLSSVEAFADPAKVEELKRQLETHEHLQENIDLIRNDMNMFVVPEFNKRINKLQAEMDGLILLHGDVREHINSAISREEYVDIESTQPSVLLQPSTPWETLVETHEQTQTTIKGAMQDIKSHWSKLNAMMNNIEHSMEKQNNCWNETTSYFDHLSRVLMDSEPDTVLTPSYRISGTWEWTAYCGGSPPYTGSFSIGALPRDNGFSGSFSGTHYGTITTGRLNGNQVTFIRKFGDRTQSWTGTLFGNELNGTLTDAKHSSIGLPTSCKFNAIRRGSN